ncbi:MAG: oligoendopeptidase F [Christensenellales bacterium]|nr:oligoendopeptidase F [Christensenellales bacterium]
MELKTREQVEKRFTWDLTQIFENDDAWQTAFRACEQKMDVIGTVPGTLGVSAESLKKGLDTVFQQMKEVERIYLYALLKKAEDNGADRYQEMSARAMGLLMQINMASAFMSPELLQIPQEKLDSFMAGAELEKYRHFVEKICRSRAYTLDAERERMLAMMSEIAESPSEIFNMFESVDMTFPNVRDESGKEVPLTHASFGKLRESRNADVRREVSRTYFAEFSKYINMLAATYAGNVKLDCFFSKVRGFENACQSALFSDNIPTELYDNLITAVEKGLPALNRYTELQRDRLGLKEINLYDMNTPIVENVDIHLSYEDACQMVREALKPLGEEYGKLLERAFSQRWIDVYENKGKTTGAFSCDVYGVHPYVLLNFTGTLRDAYVIAHELGHSLHSYLSDACQDYVNHRYSIFVAEVASTVNEVLMTRHLLKVQKDPSRRAYVLNQFLDGFRATVFRQTLFAEFEKKTHEMEEEGIPLTARALTELYHSLNKKYYSVCGQDGEFMDVEWARIPHFYSAFYVYQYATGFCSAVRLVDRILNENGREDYLKFLSAGGSDYPMNVLRAAGVDLLRPETLEESIFRFQEAVEELEQLLTE